MFRVLANEKRLLALCYLAEGEKSVGDLAHLLEISQSHLSQHLTRLRSERLVKSEKKGKRTYYSLYDRSVTKLVRSICDLYYRRESGAAIS